MPELKKSDCFEPSITSKKIWLGTRKNELPIGDGGVIIPGLFQTHNPFLDSFLMNVLILLDLFGYIFFVTSGFGSVIPLFILVELICVVLKQYPVTQKLCKYSNELILIKNAEPREVAITQNEIRKFKSYGIILSMIITASAVVKIGLFIAGGFILFSFLAPLALISYCFSAYLKINYSGYYLAELFTTISFYLDRKGWVRKTENGAVRREHQFVSPIQLNSSYVRLKVPFPADETESILKKWFQNLPGKNENEFVGAIQIPIDEELRKKIFEWIKPRPVIHDKISNGHQGFIQIPVDKVTWDSLLHQTVSDDKLPCAEMIWQQNNKIKHILSTNSDSDDQEEKKDYLICTGIDDQNRFKYKLSTFGIITDDERDKMLEDQNVLAKMNLTKEILFHQVNIFSNRI